MCVFVCVSECRHPVCERVCSCFQFTSYAEKQHQSNSLHFNKSCSTTNPNKRLVVFQTSKHHEGEESSSDEEDETQVALERKLSAHAPRKISRGQSRMSQVSGEVKDGEVVEEEEEKVRSQAGRGLGRARRGGQSGCCGRVGRVARGRAGQRRGRAW